MTSTVFALAILALGTQFAKAVGPFAASYGQLPESLRRASDLMPPALLAALVAIQTFTTGTSLILDARSVGVAVGAAAVIARAPFVVVAVLAAAATALVRLVA